MRLTDTLAMDGHRWVEGFLLNFLVVLFFFDTFKALCGAVLPQNEVRKQRLISYIEMGDCLLFYH